MKKLLLCSLVALTLSSIVTGCSTTKPDGTVTSPATTPPTDMQQKLSDLQRSRDRGLITESQYQEQKTWLLKNQ